jgi:hypothetical protein
MRILQRSERRYTTPQIHKLLEEYRQRALLLKPRSSQERATLFKQPERLNQTFNSLGGF